jgi:bifunctional enzyme CysN/CysC
MKQAPLRVVVCGHIDHGKSTLIGRLLHECHAVPEAKRLEIAKAAERRGVEFEWAFLLDALQSERNQNVTIDASRLWLRREMRDIILIDVPGHEQFLKNMVSGAAEAELGLLILDANTAMTAQARRHALLMRLLGVRDVIIAINKMDRAGFDQAVFNKAAMEAAAALADLDLKAICTLPISAKGGDNLAAKSPNLAWFSGPTLLQALDTYQSRENTNAAKAPLRFMVQDVLRREEDRYYLGQIQQGKIAVGDEVLILPINRRARIKGIYKGVDSLPSPHATAGEAIALALDYPLFIERGALIAAIDQPPKLARNLVGDVFWLKDTVPSIDDPLVLRMKSLSVRATIVGEEASPVHGELRRLQIRAAHAVGCEGSDAPLGNFLLQENGVTVALGSFAPDAIEDELRNTHTGSTNVSWSRHRIESAQRALNQGHRGLVVWLTGLPASGKSTLAMELEKRLFERGWKSYVLDGDNLRHGLSADLGFDMQGRRESVRRAGEVAELFADAGMISLVALVSPIAADRLQARRKSSDHFFEVYVKASPAVCASRDPKKLYEKAKRGEITDFTGVNAPYESPESPDLVIDTETMSIEQAASLLEESILGWAKL